MIEQVQTLSRDSHEHGCHLRRGVRLMVKTEFHSLMNEFLHMHSVLYLGINECLYAPLLLSINVISQPHTPAMEM